MAVAEAIRRIKRQMETAFPPDDLDGYVAQPGFAEIGKAEEIVR